MTSVDVREHGVSPDLFVTEAQPVDLGRLLREVAPAYGETWPAVYESLQADPAEFEVIETLALELLDSGADLFARPVRVETRSDEGEEPLPPNDGTWWRVGNGMHRVLATILLCHDRVQVTGVVEDTPPGERELEVSFTLDHSEATTPTSTWSTDHDDLDFVSWLRSFPLPDGTWIELLSSGSFRRTVECVYTCTEDQVDDVLRELGNRCSRHGVKMTLVDHVLRPADYWDTQDDS